MGGGSGNTAGDWRSGSSAQNVETVVFEQSNVKVCRSGIDPSKESSEPSIPFPFLAFHLLFWAFTFPLPFSVLLHSSLIFFVFRFQAFCVSFNWAYVQKLRGLSCAPKTCLSLCTYRIEEFFFPNSRSV